MVKVSAITIFLSLLPSLIALFMMLRLNKNLFKESAVACLRMLAQLSVLSFALKYIFKFDGALVLALAFGFMLFVAVKTIHSRMKMKTEGLLSSLFFGLFLTMGGLLLYSLAVVFDVLPSVTSSFAIPILGILIGNSLTGVTLALNNFFEKLKHQKTIIEFRISQGQVLNKILAPFVAEALRTGLTPIINSMMVVGLISIPGVMTGQLLAGQQSLQAGMYQMVILFLIFAATSFSILLSIFKIKQKLINKKFGIIEFHKILEKPHV